MGQYQNSKGKWFKIRPFEPSDLERVLEIAELAWEPIYNGFREQMGDEMYTAFYPDWRTAKRAHIRRLMESGVGFVTLDEDVVVGFCSYAHEEGAVTGTVMDNAVHPAWGGNGIGSMQNRWILEFLRSIGVKYVRVHTGLDDAHAPARKAYERVGFDHSVPNVVYYQKLDEACSEE